MKYQILASLTQRYKSSNYDQCFILKTVPDGAKRSNSSHLSFGYVVKSTLIGLPLKYLKKKKRKKSQLTCISIKKSLIESSL